MADVNLVQAVKDHALVHYNDGGWDVLVECWGDEEIAEIIAEAGAETAADAIASFKDVVSVWSDRQVDAIISAYGSYESMVSED